MIRRRLPWLLMLVVVIAAPLTVTPDSVAAVGKEALEFAGSDGFLGAIGAAVVVVPLFLAVLYTMLARYQARRGKRKP